MSQRALLVIDLQKGLENDTHKLYHLSSVIDRVNQRIALYREKQLPIIFIQHEEQDMAFEADNWQLFTALDAQSEDFYVRKTHANSFFQTNLTALLNSLAVTELEFAGAQTEFCVDTTIRMAHGLGYTNFMTQGASTTLDNSLLPASTIIQHHENIWNHRWLTFI